jgi:hypothetical protein
MSTPQAARSQPCLPRHQRPRFQIRHRFWIAGAANTGTGIRRVQHGCLYSERSGCAHCTHVGAVSNSGVLRCWCRTVVSVPFLLLMLETLAIVGVACNTVFVLQSSSALVHSVMYNWRLNRLACLPSMLLTGVDALTAMVLLRVACMHHDPRLSYTRWQVSSCWC